MSSEVKHYWPEEIVGTGELVVYLQDYAALEAERAEQWRLRRDAEAGRDVALAVAAELRAELAASEKRGSELAAYFCDGVIGDDYGHAHCKYKTGLKNLLSAAERCQNCSTITAVLNNDHCAKWCSFCGGRLEGDYVPVEELLNARRT